MHFERLARFFVCLATVVFMGWCRRLDLVIEWTMYSCSVRTATTDTSSKQDGGLDDD